MSRHFYLAFLLQFQSLVSICWSLDASIQQLKVYISQGNCSTSGVSIPDLNQYTSLLTSNTADSMAYCSEFEFNSEISNSAKHCNNHPETCGEGITVKGSLEAKLGEVSEFVKNFPRSCKDIVQQQASPKTGYHLIKAPNNSFIEVYCNFDLTFNGKTGWIRVMNVNMSQADASCPEGLYTYKFEGLSYPLCDREHFVGKHCDSTSIATHGMKFSTVVGRVRGYQQGGLDGIYQNNVGDSFIDGAYVDGVSITYGQPRNHIWTFIGGQGEGHAYWEDCPCNSGSTEVLLSFVGNDYYCESGVYAPTSYTFYYGDPLWDGEQCGYLESPCCNNPNLPWFVKELNTNTTENIELRICSSEGYPDEVTALDLIEIYVQ